MSLYGYEKSKELAAQDIPFSALIMAAMRRADGPNERLLRLGWPEVWYELKARYNAPGGLLPGEPGHEPTTNIVRTLQDGDRFIP